MPTPLVASPLDGTSSDIQPQKAAHSSVTDAADLSYSVKSRSVASVPAVTGKARYFFRRHGTDLAKAYLGHHKVEASPDNAVGGRSTEVVVDRLDLGPAQPGRPFAHVML